MDHSVNVSDYSHPEFLKVKETKENDKQCRHVLAYFGCLPRSHKIGPPDPDATTEIHSTYGSQVTVNLMLK